MVSGQSPGQNAGEGLVTGDAVVLDLRLARLPTRMLSFAVDLTVQVLLGVGFAIFDAYVLDGATIQLTGAVTITEVVAVLIGYPLAMETLTRGRTLGKLVLGLRTVRDDGGSIGFAQALVRALAGIADFWVTSFVVGLLVAAFNPQDKRLGDLLAGTVVVRERTPTTITAPPTMPAGLEAWASTLQLSVLPDDLARAGRRYLQRAPTMSGSASWFRAVELATAVSRVTAPSPPPGVPPAVYVQAVLAERHRRAMASLAAGPAGYRAGS